MIIIVDWDAKHQFIQTNKHLLADSLASLFLTYTIKGAWDGAPKETSTLSSTQ